MDLYRALEPKGIRLMLYLPCQVPNGDDRAQKAFGLPQGRKDQPIDIEFARKWAQVIQEWSDRYGDKVAGWWFDGGYEWIHFNEEIGQIYAAAVKHGNPKAIVTFNPGISLVRHTLAEDYTAGELNEPFDVLPTSRWVDGSQWHALTFLGSQWGRPRHAVSRGEMGPVGQRRGLQGRRRHAGHGSQLGPAGRANRLVGPSSGGAGRGGSRRREVGCRPVQKR